MNVEDILAEAREDEPSLILPEEFWEARPLLADIRRAAHSRALSGDAVLHCILARVAGSIPHTLKLPAIVGGQSPLCYFTGLIALSGIGKSASTALAKELVPVNDHVLDGLPIGSGEGLVEVLFGWIDDGSGKRRKEQTRFNAIVNVDEGTAVAALGARSGSTTLSTLRSIWSGGVLGNTNASRETNRLIPEGMYTYGLTMAFQPTKADVLLADVDAGTPQRFTWVWATDPTIPDETPPRFGPLPWRPPTSFHGTIERRLPTVTHELRVDEVIRKEIRANNLAKSRGEVEVGEFEGHADLLRLRVAALLGILDERLDVSTEDWHLAGVVMHTSNRVRQHVRGIVATARQARDSASSQRNAEREVDAQDAKHGAQVEKALRRTLKLAHRNEGSISERTARNGLSTPLRGFLPEAVDLGAERRWIDIHVEDGQRGLKRIFNLTDIGRVVDS